MGAYSRKIHVCNTHIQWYVLFQWGFHSPLLKGALGFLELVSNGVESLAVLKFTFIVEFHHGFQTTCALTAHRMVGMRKTPDRPLPVTVPMWRFGRSVGSAMRRFWLRIQPLGSSRDFSELRFPPLCNGPNLAGLRWRVHGRMYAAGWCTAWASFPQGAWFCLPAGPLGPVLLQREVFLAPPTPALAPPMAALTPPTAALTPPRGRFRAGMRSDIWEGGALPHETCLSEN